VVITGASSGSGRACALLLDARGFRVFAGVRKDEDAAAVRRLASDRLTPLLLDVTDTASIAAAQERVATALGGAGLAGLVNNAGIGISGPLELLPPEEVRAVFEVNVFGLLAVTQAFVPLLKQGQGRLMNIGSVGGRITMPFAGALTASKYAVESLSDALRLELRPWGVHVVLIEPGSIHTEAVEKVARQGERLAAELTKHGHPWHGAALAHFTAIMAERERGGSPPEVVAQAVLRALTAARPRTRYPVGAHAHLLLTLATLLPDRTLDLLRLRLFGLPVPFGAATRASQPDIPS
jgi:NAD(P)-dependent dehydrogenase (short-subunit alcohol dehydrogenase family)